MQNVMARGDGPASALPAMGILLGFAAVLTLIAVRLFRWDEIELPVSGRLGLLTIPSGRDPAPPAWGAEGATSPEPLRHPGPDGTGVSGVAGPVPGHGDRGGGPATGYTGIPVAPPGGCHGLRITSHRASTGRPAADAGRGRLSVAGRADRRRAATRAGQHRSRRAAAARAAVGGRGGGRAAPAGGPEHRADLDDRAGLLPGGHPGGDPPQRAGKPRLVHRVHALPAGDSTGPAGGTAQLPDHGRRPHWAAGGRRLAAGRVDCGRRGDDAVPAGGREGQHLPGRRRLPAADAGGAGHPGRAARHRAGGRPGHRRAGGRAAGR